MKCLQNFEFGTVGALVNVLDGGFGATRFDSVTPNGTAGPIYSTAHTHLGDQMCKIDAGAGAVSNYVEWFAKLKGSQTDTFGRGYFQFDSLPSGNTDLFRITSTSGNTLIVQVNSTGHIRVPLTGITALLSTNVISTGSLFRIECESKPGDVVQTVKLFLTPESSTPTETITGTPSGGPSDIIKTRWGQVSGTANAVYYMAHVEFNNTGYPGPYSATTPPVTTWYVSKNGNNNTGLDWANAWNELDQIDYAQIAPGDVVVIDGGATRYHSSDDFGYDFINHATHRPGLLAGMMYTAPWVVQGSGSSGLPITFTTSDETGRDGTVVVYGGRAALLPEANSTGYNIAANQGRQIGINVRGVSYISFLPKHRSQIMVYGMGVGAADTSLLPGDGCGFRFDSSSHDITIRNFEIFDCGNFGEYNRPSDSALVFKTDQEGISLFSGTNVVIERCLIHDCGQDPMQGGPAPGFVLRNNWLYGRREHSTWLGYGFQAGNQAVPDQNTTHVDGIQMYNAGLGTDGATATQCVFGPMVNQGFYLGDGTLASYDNVTVSDCLFVLPFSHGIQGDQGDSATGVKGTTPANWVIDHCTIHAPSTPRPGGAVVWRPIEIEGGKNHRVTNTIATWGGIFFQTTPTNWDTANCSGNIYFGGGDPLPGGTNVDPLFKNPIAATNNTPTFAQAIALDLTPQASAALGKGSSLHSVRDLLNEIDVLNGEIPLGQLGFFLPPTVYRYPEQWQDWPGKKEEKQGTRPKLFYLSGVGQDVVVGGVTYYGGRWNGPLSAAQIAALTSAGYGSRIAYASNPGLLPADIGVGGAPPPATGGYTDTYGDVI